MQAFRAMWLYWDRRAFYGRVNFIIANNDFVNLNLKKITKQIINMVVKLIQNSLKNNLKFIYHSIVT